MTKPAAVEIRDHPVIYEITLRSLGRIWDQREPRNELQILDASNCHMLAPALYDVTIPLFAFELYYTDRIGPICKSNL